jgi:hypothetical protein
LVPVKVKFQGMNETLSVVDAGKRGGKARARNQTKAERIRLARMGGLASGAARKKNKKKVLTKTEQSV